MGNKDIDALPRPPWPGEERKKKEPVSLPPLAGSLEFELAVVVERDGKDTLVGYTAISVPEQEFRTVMEGLTGILYGPDDKALSEVYKKVRKSLTRSVTRGTQIKPADAIMAVCLPLICYIGPTDMIKVIIRRGIFYFVRRPTPIRPLIIRPKGPDLDKLFELAR